MRKPNNFWIKENCALEALKYSSRTEFQKQSSGAYDASLKNGWLNDLCVHMVRPHYKIWTKDKCAEEALKYESRINFSNNCKGAYYTSIKNGWTDEICLHMISKMTYWTKEICIIEALKCESRINFANKCRGAYRASIKNNWIDEVCSHIISNRIPNNYWNKENCTAEALKYDTRKKFQDNSGNAYLFARKNDLLDKICSHMKVIGNRFIRCIYAAEFNNKSVYIGLTYDFDKRTYDHMHDKNSQVYKESINSGENPIFKQLCDYISVENAKIKEGFFVNKYRSDNWTILNIAKTGAVGGGYRKWSKELCKIEAEKYHTKIAFMRNAKGAYSAAYRNKWLNEICSHMIELFKYKTECYTEALKYKNRTEFYKNASGLYSKARKNGWLDEICEHMSKHVYVNNF